MTDDEINRRFPYQIVLPAQWYSGANFRLVHAFCIGLSLAPRGHAVTQGNEWRYIFCFAKREDAESIRQRFGDDAVGRAQRIDARGKIDRRGT